ncbi:hypothetical protein C2845_PM12G16810 [Panicum miliaceum]|uniref:Uncharacterized protein n=1 Tax=Panicum miliaceum TaxID=4540 RepID=A0A3L6QJ94_PANMI|nr:hypothetical protein C2845_PM12G16810 [Panicum miliaceum]
MGVPSLPGSCTLQPSPPPPPYAAGDQPAAPPPGKNSAGDPLATPRAEEFGPVTPVSCRTSGGRFSAVQGEALELHYCSSAEHGDSSAAGAVRMETTEAAGNRGAGGLRLCSIIVKPSSHRVSSIKDRLGPRQPESNFCFILKAKAVGRCFNCFAKDHRIAECRDPQRCILYSRCGHKARFCTRDTGKAATDAASTVYRRASADGGAPEADREGSMEFTPGDVELRPESVQTCAAWSFDLRDAERDLNLRALIAVQRDVRVCLSCAEVHRDVHGLVVTKISISSFLLRFERQEVRNAARERVQLVVARTALHVLPRTRQANAVLGRLRYRTRLCIEGVPSHAHKVETVLHLLPKQSFLDEVVSERETEDELGCYILWIWCMDPDAIAKAGTLRIAEPVLPPANYFERVGNMEWPELRMEAAVMLGYPVLIHLDRVVDYSSPPGSPSHQSYESDISGVPNVEWPVHHRYSWQLGVMDGQLAEHRPLVHSCLGGRRAARRLEMTGAKYRGCRCPRLAGMTSTDPSSGTKEDRAGQMAMGGGRITT